MPVTEEAKRDLIRQLKKEVHSNPDLTAMDDGQMRALIQRTLDAKLAWARDNSPEAYRELSSLNFRERHQIAGAVYESIRGLGVLGQIIADPDITEVMINGYQDIFVERAGRLTKLENHFESRQELETIITKFVSQSGRVVNESEPIVDTHLEDGSRVNVVMPPVALNGPIVTIRRFPKEAMTVEKLIGYGSITPEVARVLEMLVRARYNIFVSGGTGSGKTTFLNALSNFIPRDERIITIEDSAELQIKHIDNLVRLETSNAGPDGSGAITIRDLIKSSLRMRPDRIVVGEVRGGEALDMLQAMNTGHDGSLSTGQYQRYLNDQPGVLTEQQRQQLGVETLLPYDRALVFPEGNAVPVAAEELPKAAGRMYHALSPEAGHFFDEMIRHDLLDVAGSPNKISGMGFCDMLGAPCGMPFIFANCDGTGSDVTVYTHELGHGLQGYLSYRSQPLADYVGLSPDLAEVHSKTMELLTLPYAREFFGPHAPQFLTEHRYDFIKELCAFCSIHTFETWLYEHPDASLSQWAEEFDRTEKVFGRAQNNEPWQQQVLAGCDLFTNMAIYMFPRYVVSYALSIVCAQQLKAAYDADPVDGWARYHALCASGGSKLYAETLAAAGLELPYAPGVVERLARELAAQA